MKKTTVLNTVATIYLVAGILFISMADSNIGFGIMAVLSFLGAYGFNDVAESISEKETILNNQWYECGQYPDY